MEFYWTLSGGDTARDVPEVSLRAQLRTSSRLRVSIEYHRSKPLRQIENRESAARRIARNSDGSISFVIRVAVITPWGKENKKKKKRENPLRTIPYHANCFSPPMVMCLDYIGFRVVSCRGSGGISRDLRLWKYNTRTFRKLRRSRYLRYLDATTKLAPSLKEPWF